MYNEFEDYYYENTETLKNKYNVKDDEKLNKIEHDIVQNNLLTISTVTGTFDFQHLCNIHKHLFSDLYDWAGQPREVEMCKDEPILGGRSVRYAAHSQIAGNARDAIKKLHKEDWNNLGIEQKADSLAKITAELWKVHPFREGNTRTVIAFITTFAEERGFPMEITVFGQNPKFVRDALVLAANNNDYTGLKQAFEHSLELAQCAKKSKERESDYEL